VIGRGHHAIGQACAHRGAGGDEAERGAFGDLAGELHRRRLHLVLRHQLVGKTPFDGLFAGDAAAGVEHQLGVVLADQLGQRRGQAEAGMETEFCEIR